MIESPTVNRWKAEAAIKAKIEGIVAILQDRFGPLPADASSKIEATTSLDALQLWLVLAARVGSLDDFRRDAKI